MKAFVGAMTRAGVTLRGYLDPSRGTDTDSAKHSEWLERFRQGMARADAIEHYCGRATESGPIIRGGQPDPRVEWSQPPMAHRAMISTLRHLKVELETCLGEADGYLVDSLEPTGAFAILAQDSDFCVMRGSRYLPMSLLRQEEGDEDRIHARLFTPELVAASLRLPVERLVDLSALCGNDITKAALKEAATHKHLAIKATASGALPPIEVAAWLSRLPEGLAIEEDDKLSLLLVQHPELATALERSRCFYLRQPDPTAPHSASPEESLPNQENGDEERFLEVLRDGVAKGKFPSYCLAVRENRIHWGSSRLRTEPGIDTLLQPLRRVMYGLLGVDQVTEIVRGEADDRDQILEQVGSLTRPCSWSPVLRSALIRPSHRWCRHKPWLAMSRFREVSSSRRTGIWRMCHGSACCTTSCTPRPNERWTC